MKQSKAPMSLKDHTAYAAAKEKLAQLESRLAETVLRIEGHKILALRSTPDSRRYLERAMVLPNMTEQIFDDVSAKVILAGEVTPQFIARLQSQIPKPNNFDSYDLEIITEIQGTKAALLLLNRAVALQNAEVVRQKAAAIAAILNSVQTERDGIAKIVATRFLELAAALRDERELVDRLRIQDDSIPDLLSPPPFPAQILSEAPVLEWIARALKEQAIEVKTLINEASPREMVQTAE